MNRAKAIIAVFAVALLGAGCSSEVQPTPLDQAATGVRALKQTQQLSADVAAQKRRVEDETANLLPVAVVLPDGHEAPSEGVERLADEKFGCLDRIGYVRVSRESDSGDIVRDALNTLFAVPEPTVGGSVMLNSLWESELSVAQIRSTDGATTEVWLEGELVSPGTCADPRIKEQVEATVRQYRPQYKIFLNGSESEWRCFGDGSGLCE